MDDSFAEMNKKVQEIAAKYGIEVELVEESKEDASFLCVKISDDAPDDLADKFKKDFDALFNIEPENFITPEHVFYDTISDLHEYSLLEEGWDGEGSKPLHKEMFMIFGAELFHQLEDVAEYLEVETDYDNKGVLTLDFTCEKKLLTLRAEYFGEVEEGLHIEVHCDAKKDGKIMADNLALKDMQQLPDVWFTWLLDPDAEYVTR